jgi:hypothetical protein
LPPPPFPAWQTPIGDITEFIGPVNLHNVGARLLTISLGLYYPPNPRHATRPPQVQKLTRKYHFQRFTPNLEAVPVLRVTIAIFESSLCFGDRQ